MAVPKDVRMMRPVKKAVMTNVWILTKVQLKKIAAIKKVNNQSRLNINPRVYLVYPGIFCATHFNI
jgi:hypothetical protein